MMEKQRGISLLELIVFIVVMGIIATSILASMNLILNKMGASRYILQANQLAQGRIEIISQQRRAIGFTNFTDPCSSGSPPAVCTALSTFASSNGFTVVSNITNDSTNYKLITVTVTGNANATLIARVANYDNT